jgi:hypothetical protein
MTKRSVLVTALAVTVLLSGCAASSKTFYANPGKVRDTQLCRTFLDAAQKNDLQFATDTATEAKRRDLTLEECQRKVATEDAVLIGALVVGTAVGVGIACQNGCAGGSYSAPSYRSGDYDCYGRSGNGPNYIRGPVQVGSYDPYDLDRDGDGIGCEAGDFGA